MLNASVLIGFICFIGIATGLLLQRLGISFLEIDEIFNLSMLYTGADLALKGWVLNICTIIAPVSIYLHYNSAIAVQLQCNYEIIVNLSVKYL